MNRRAAILLLAAAAWMPATGALAGEAEIIADLQRQIARCWVIPQGVTKRTTPVTLTFKLGRDGSLQSVPLIVRNPMVLEYGKNFVISASKAMTMTVSQSSIFSGMTVTSSCAAGSGTSAGRWWGSWMCMGSVSG